jgi:hypothetical protein
MAAQETLEQGTRELLDRHQITECLLRYTRGADRCDPELIRSAFHADATDYHGSVDGSPEDFLDWWLPQQSARESTQHFLSNLSIEIDGCEAHSEAYYTAVIKLRDHDELRVVGGRYVDRLTRRDGEWRIATRVTMADWTTVADATNMAMFIGGAHHSSRDQTDPYYQRPLLGPSTMVTR